MTLDAAEMIVGLLAKRAQIETEIADAQHLIRGLVDNLDHIDATIRSFDPDAKLASQASTIPPRHTAFKGENRRFIMEALKSATAPLTSLDITRRVISGRGLPDDRSNLVLFRKRVSANLWKLMQRGVVRQVPLAGEYKGWELIR